MSSGGRTPRYIRIRTVCSGYPDRAYNNLRGPVWLEPATKHKRSFTVSRNAISSGQSSCLPLVLGKLRIDVREIEERDRKWALEPYAVQTD
jgi:hypothetical protein